MLLALSVSLAAASPASAQTDPASIERTIPKLESKPVEDKPRIATPALPPEKGIRVTGTFVLGAVNIEGSTVFNSAELAQSFEPYLASSVGQAELDKITADITERYRRAGYVLSYAILPEQSVQSGIVRIRVVEGFVERVRIQADRKSATAIRSLVERLSAERPLKKDTLERTLGLVRDVPGVTLADTRISRRPGDPARHILTLVLRGNAVRALTYLDNRGTIDGARLRSYSSVSIASLAIPGDQLQLDVFSIPSDDFRFLYGQAKASIPLNSDGLRFLASVSRGDQLQRFAGPDQHGKSRLFAAEISYPFVLSRSFSVSGHASLADWRSEEIRAGTTIQRDRIQVARAWVEFSRSAKTRIDGRIGLSRGVDLGSATDKGDPLASRPGASSKFTKIDARMQLVAPLSDRWYLRLVSEAQYSTKPLLAPEEFALGGSRIGRAFDFNEITGDHGVGGMIEVNYRLPEAKRGPKRVELFAFADGGGAFRRRSTPGLTREAWLVSAGVGARMNIFGLLLSGELGKGLANGDRDRDYRAFFSATKAF